MSNEVSFFLNGKKVVLQNPSPTLLLIDYLRSSELGLIGAKKGCGQGGCGACTVILSTWDAQNNKAKHRSINSCLRPVCSLGGMAITTIEGTGGVDRPPNKYFSFIPSSSRGGAIALQAPSEAWNALKEALTELEQHSHKAIKVKTRSAPKKDVEKDVDLHEGVNPVAHRLAINNGTQCGYCTVGFVMNMSAFLSAHPNPTKKEIEAIFDGNICRCTGYRAILTGMKTFASDKTKEDEKNRMKCKTEDNCKHLLAQDQVNIPFPNAAKEALPVVSIQKEKRAWTTPRNLKELTAILRNNPPKTTRMVMGNTSFGVYAEEFPEVQLFVDIKLIPDLYGIRINANGIEIGAANTYSELLELLQNLSKSNPYSPVSRYGTFEYMTHRTAGMIVRNAASLAGNTMLTLKHIEHGEPFPSDLLTALDGAQASIKYLRVQSGQIHKNTIAELVRQVADTPSIADDLVLIAYFLPKGWDNEVVLSQKVALRQVNSHSIVNNCSRLVLSDELEIVDANLVYGGIATYPWHAEETEQALKGRTLSLALISEIISILQNEVSRELTDNEGRMQEVKSEGFTNEYKLSLAISFFYKLIVKALLEKAPDQVPPYLKSTGKIDWGNWPVTKGTQSYEKEAFEDPVSKPYIKLMAFHQAMGQVHYTHEIPFPEFGKNAAFIQSQCALGKYQFIDPDSKKSIHHEKLEQHLKAKYPEFYALITHHDIPTGGQNNQGIGFDQPLLAVDEVRYYGQIIAMVIAETEAGAIEIAEYASKYCVAYNKIDWPGEWKKPILSIDRAIEMGSVFPDNPKTASYVTHIWKIIRPNSAMYWVDQTKNPLDKAPNKRDYQIDGIPCQVLENTQVSGGQAHFYMETQACLALPEDGDQFLIHPSSQSPLEMHQTTATALASPLNKINIEVRQLGGGYGGKTEQAKFIAGPTAIAAHSLKLPIRLVMKREHDTEIIGKRHGLYGQYQIAVDKGEIREEDKGIIRGFFVKMWADGGAFYDCSFIVTDCIQLRIDNAYNIKNFESRIDVCRTNKAPSTAMRAFGDIQGKLVLENAIDDAAFAVGMDPVALREKNMYYRGDVTPFGQALSYCYMRDVWDYIQEKSDYKKRLKKVKDFNEKSKWKKKGIYIVPVKYGSGYNLVMLEQAAAVISIYSGDGSISINQGGVDMGQGMLTKIEQVASYVLNVPMDLIQVNSPATRVIPNPTSTGGSTGTAYNGEAVRQVAEKMRSRLMDFAYQLLKDNGEDWCKEQGIDFWNHGKKGWATLVKRKIDKHPRLMWQNLVGLAYQYRVDLVASFTAPIPGGTTPVPNRIYKSPDEQKAIPGIELEKVKSSAGNVDSFIGFTYSAACSEVELDVLTGEVKILRSDIVYDMGRSLNPAIDIGQVEGAFVQGIGYVLTENLHFEEKEDHKGRLNTVNTWRYKPPAISTIPLELNTHLYPRSNSKEVPENPYGLFSSKEVGEPPLVLAASVFFALKAAIRASREERNLSTIFKFDAPATVQQVRSACAVSIEHLTE